MNAWFNCAYARLKSQLMKLVYLPDRLSDCVQKHVRCSFATTQYALASLTERQERPHLCTDADAAPAGSPNHDN